MKERYHKLQKKMALIEDDNQRLISGKSELFGEIGKLQVIMTNLSIFYRSSMLDLNSYLYGHFVLQKTSTILAGIFVSLRRVIPNSRDKI